MQSCLWGGVNAIDGFDFPIELQWLKLTMQTNFLFHIDETENCIYS
jgi:hypothetical protein